MTTLSAATAARAADGQLKNLRPIVKIWDAKAVLENSQDIPDSFRRLVTNVGSATAFDMHSRLTFFDAKNVVIFQRESPFDLDLAPAQESAEDYRPNTAGWSEVAPRLNRREEGIHYRVDIRYRFDPAASEWYGSKHSGKVRLVAGGWLWATAGGSELDRPAVGRLFPVNQPQ